MPSNATELPYFLSIIIVSANRSELLETLSSVSEISTTKYEVIICEKQTLNFDSKLFKNTEIMRIKWKGGLEKGIYDSINNGIQISSGKVIWILNGGDVAILPNNMGLLAEALAHSSNLWLTAMQINSKYRMSKSKIANKFSNELALMGIKPIPHQSSLYKREIFERFGLYRTDLNIWADHYLHLELLTNNHLPLNYPYFVTIHKPGGAGDLQEFGSLKKQTKKYLKMTNMRIHKNYFVEKILKVIGMSVFFLQWAKSKVKTIINSYDKI